jgi:hypothetical protein
MPENIQYKSATNKSSIGKHKAWYIIFLLRKCYATNLLVAKEGLSSARTNGDFYKPY